MSLISWSQEDLLTFFAVLVRFSVLVSVMPIVGDYFVPQLMKIFLALAISMALFPSLISTGYVRPGEALVWGYSGFGIISTIFLEALFGFVLGFVAKLSFDTIQFGSNLIGNFMGFATANYYDPHQESQTQVVAEFHMALAILIFLALDGHHFMLRSVLNSYQIVGLGKAGITGALGQKLIEQTTQVISFGVQLAAPMAISLFAVNIVFGVLAKSMPQLNILVLSFSVSILVGFLVLLLGITDFQVAAGNILERMNDSLQEAMMAMKY